MQRWVPGTGVVVPGLAVLLSLTACGGGGDDPHADDAKEPVTVVEVATVARGEVAERLSTSAVVESEAEAAVLPVSGGIVREVLKDEGDPVRRGDLLAVLDNATLEAGAERARSDLDKLQHDYETVKGLHAAGAASDQELADASHALDGARTSATEAVRTQGQTRLVAPFDGVVAKRDVRVGEYASPSAVAFEIVDPARLRVVASFPERDLARITDGEAAQLVSAYDETLAATGHVERVAPVVDPSTGTFRVTIAVDPGQKLRPGQFVDVAVEVDRHQDVVTIPRQAIAWEDGVAVVYEMVPAPPPTTEEKPADKADDGYGFPAWLAKAVGSTDGPHKDAAPADDAPKYVAKRIEPEVGLVDAGTAEVLKGVDPGAQVIVVGQSNLRDGAPVETSEMRAAEKKPAADGTAG